MNNPKKFHDIFLNFFNKECFKNNFDVQEFLVQDIAYTESHFDDDPEYKSTFLHILENLRRNDFSEKNPSETLTCFLILYSTRENYYQEAFSEKDLQRLFLLNEQFPNLFPAETVDSIPLNLQEGLDLGASLGLKNVQ